MDIVRIIVLFWGLITRDLEYFLGDCNMLKHVLLYRSRIEIPQNDLIIPGQYSGPRQSRSWKRFADWKMFHFQRTFVVFHFNYFISPLSNTQV